MLSCTLPVPLRNYLTDSNYRAGVYRLNLLDKASSVPQKNSPRSDMRR
jgi:hypothetical protein